MASQWLIIAAVVAVSSAAVVKPLFYPAAAYHPAHPSSPAQYNYKYKVEDWQTGDIKDKHERRVGDKVEGYYSLVEPDGARRTVKYTADAHSGFNAVVYREPPPSAHPVTPAPVRTVLLPAPQHYAAPVPKHGPVQFPAPDPTPVLAPAYIPLHGHYAPSHSQHPGYSLYH